MKFKNYLKLCALVILILSLIPLMLVSLWSISFGFVVGYLGVILILGNLIYCLKKRYKKLIVLIPPFWITLNVLMMSSTVSKYDTVISIYYKKVCSEQELKINEKINIYGLNLIMSFIAYPIYPEVAKESLYLCIPSKKNQREFRSKFFLKSKKIKRLLENYNINEEYKVTWSLNDYNIGNSEARYALALNPCLINMYEIDSKLYCRAKVKVEYPMSCEVTLIKWPVTIKVEEGLFGYLQNCGWLHPYEAIWIAKVK